MTFPAFKANWIVNDYAALKRREPERGQPVRYWVVLMLWWTELIPSTYARARLRDLYRGAA